MSVPINDLNVEMVDVGSTLVYMMFRQPDS